MLPSSGDPAARRRLAALSALAAAAAGLGIAVGSVGGDEGGESEQRAARPAASAAPQEVVDRLSLEQQVGQLLVMSFDETEAPGYIRRRLRREQGAGVVLFADNTLDPETAAALTDQIQRAAGGDALVAADQEGGTIRSVPGAEPDLAQSSIETADQAGTEAEEGAAAMRDAGVNVNLAPVADVAIDSSSVMADRAYSGDAQLVSEFVAAAVEAWVAGDVAPTAKHFPGIGLAFENTDDVSVQIDATREELEESDLLPFEAAIGAGVPLVMVSHALYPDLDPELIASQSPAVVDELLRSDLGFEGVVITDSLEAQAVLDRSEPADAAVASVEAGVDLILMTGSDSWNLVYPALLQRARDDEGFRARVRESAARVLALKAQLGLPEPDPSP